MQSSFTVSTTDDSAASIAVALVQLGDLDGAWKAVECGIEKSGTDRRQRAFWHFRFLRSEVLRLRGLHGEALDYLDSLGSPANDDLVSQTEMCMHRGYNAAILGRYDFADKLLKCAKTLADSAALLELQGEIKVRQAMVAYFRKDYRTSESLYRSVAETQRDKHGWYLFTIARGGVGKSLMAQKRYQDALPWLEQAHDTANSVNARYRASLIAGEMAICYLGLGDSEKALQIHMAEAKFLSNLGALHAFQICLCDIGNVYFYRGDYLTALSYYHRALEIAEEIKASAAIEKCRGNIQLAHERLRRQLR